MYSLVGHSVQPSSWDYSPETEAIGWAHSSLGPTAESRQLLWIVHWFVLSLRDRRTDVSVVGCLSCLTTATRIVFIKRAQSIYGHIVVSVLQPQTEAFAPAAQNAERRPVYLGSSEGCSLSTRTSTCFVVQRSCGTRVRNFSFPCQGFSLNVCAAIADANSLPKAEASSMFAHETTNCPGSAGC